MSTWYNNDLDVKFRLKHRAPVFISGGDVPSELTWLVVITKVMTLMTSHPESPTKSVTRTTLKQKCQLADVETLNHLLSHPHYP